MNANRIIPTITRVGKLSSDKTIFFCCDLQEKFRNSIIKFPQVLNVSLRMIKAASILNIPVIVTEQYPNGLGKTCSELQVPKEYLFSKTQFSMMIPQVRELMFSEFGTGKSVVIFGIEAHICLLQTVLDLIESDHEVHVVADATSSRSEHDKFVALERIRQIGGIISTHETILFMLLKDAKHKSFKEIQSLVIPLHQL